jgi:3-hydroxyacyl-CoA dehydrogenase
MLLAADRVVAHIESYIGLVECGVGLVPAWGGCARLLARLARDPKRPGGPVAPVAQAFETIGTAKVAKSAFEARDLGFLSPDDPVVANRDRLLAEAKATALAMAEGYRPPEPEELRLPGPTGKAALGLALHDLDLEGMLTPHDRVVADALADVHSGGPDADHVEPVSEARVMALERESFLRLLRTEATLARMEHMLGTGRPLRN